MNNRNIIQVGEGKYEVQSIISTKNFIISYKEDIRNFLKGFMSLYKIHNYLDLQNNKITVLPNKGLNIREFKEYIKTK